MKALRIILVPLLFVTLSSAQTAVEAWVQRYGHAVTPTSQSLGIVSGPDGNIIVVGYTDENIVGRDMLVAKYSGAGLLLWSGRYNGPGNNNDEAQSAAVAGNGDVVVAGYSYSATTSNSSDYLTIKYADDGWPLWTNRYNGPANGFDAPVAVAVDPGGNVFVTGTSTGAGTGRDYATIAYASNGVPLWTNRYSTATVDEPKAIAVGPDGTVVVSGTSSDDYLSIAYANDGIPIWTNRYSATNTSIDRVESMAMAATGTIFLTGVSGVPGVFVDIVTLAYSNTGVPLWTNRYNGMLNDSDLGMAVTVDATGNVFVAGNSWAGSGNANDWVVLAYANSGSPLWTNHYHNSDDYAQAISASNEGKVFVTGRSYSSFYHHYRTIAYSTAGLPLWTNTAFGPGRSTRIANTVDTNGNLLVTGFANNEGVDFALAAISSTGSPLWTSQYSGNANGIDSAGAVVIDSDGNIFVTGRSDNPTNSDYATIRYSPAGLPLWTNRFNGPGNASDAPMDITLDYATNVCVTGRSFHSGRDYDFATVAYSAGGTPLWTNLYNGPGNGHDTAYAIAADRQGNVYVTGTSVGIGTGQDYATIAYSSNGVPLWTNRYSGPGNSADGAYDIAVDAADIIFVTGFSQGVPGSVFGTSDYATIAYSSAGVPLWTNRYDGPAQGGDFARAIALDHAGNVLVTGNSFGNNDDFATVAYSDLGVPLWTNRYNGPGNSIDAARGVAVDSHNNVFVTGHSVGNGSSYDYATIKYSAAGLPLWTNRYNGPVGGFDYANAIAIAPDDTVFVTGSSVGNGSTNDYATVSYSNTGAQLWVARYNGLANGSDAALALAAVPDGVVVVGESDGDFNAGNIPDFAVVKYLVVNPPEIVIQPTGITNFLGATVAFTVGAAGTPPLVYQWRRDGTNLLDGSNVSGTTTANLTLNIIMPTDAAGYSVLVTNVAGSAVSATASLVVTGLAVTLDPAALIAGRIVLSWDTVPGSTYQIQFKTNLNQAAWTDLGGQVVASDTSLSVTNNLGFGAESFFRVLFLP